MNLTEILQQHQLWLQTDGREGARADLRRADLSEADLRDADLRRADLSDADLSGADLSDADLSGADLRGADLRGADLSRASLRGASLRGANLSRASLRGANLAGANLAGAIGLPIAADAPARLRAVASAALADADALEMDTWHTCDTTHCIAGWAIHQAGEPGRILEALHGPALAGRLLLGNDAASHFCDDNDDARAWLQSVLDAPEVG